MDKNLASLLVEDAPAPQGKADDQEKVLDDDEQTDDEPDPQDDVSDEAPSDDDDEGPETYRLKVDGAEIDVTLDELVQSYQIDGAARKRLQEATEVQRRAAEEGREIGYREGRARADEEVNAITSIRAQLNELVGAMGQRMFAPQVERPAPEMQAVDPIGYLQQMDAWREEQGKLQQLQGRVANFVRQHEQMVENQRRQVMSDNQRQLLTKRPELVDRQQQAAFTANVRLAQSAVGLSNEEVNSFPDHRGLLVLDMLGAYIARDRQGGKTPAQRVVADVRAPLAPGTVTYKRTKAQKQRRADRDRAKASGDYRDVAKLLITDAPKR